MPDFNYIWANNTNSWTSPIRMSDSYTISNGSPHTISTSAYGGQNEAQAKINYLESELGKLRGELINLSRKVKEQEAKIKELELESLMK